MKKIVLLISFIILMASGGQSVPLRKQRIISLTPAITEILYSLQLEEEIIGVTTLCNFPAQAKTKTKIGTFSQPNIEKILSLNPDLVFATGLEQAALVHKLKQLKLNICVSDPSNFQELFSSIREIGKLTDREKQAESLVNHMQTKIERITSKTKSIPQAKRPKVFIEIWNDPLMTAGKGSFIDELITLAGGINIAYDTPRPYCYFSAEQVIKRNPDCVILGYMEPGNAADHIAERLGWKEIRAVKNKRIYNDINPDIILRTNPRLVDGLEEIYQRLYPDAHVSGKKPMIFTLTPPSPIKGEENFRRETASSPLAGEEIIFRRQSPLP